MALDLSRVGRLVNRPEYFFRPHRVAWAIARRRVPRPLQAQVLLPWGLRLAVRPREVIGAGVYNCGVFDLCVTEAIWRLLDPGERAVDVGANIGYTASVMAARAGPRGEVACFEPHPALFQELAANLARWKSHPRVAPAAAHQVALSSRSGIALLHVPEGFENNRGMASLSSTQGAPAMSVETQRLDALIDGDRPIGLMKIDVEGHEAAVLEGAGELLERRRVRDILFEELQAPPTRATEIFQRHGYAIFQLSTGLLRPVATPLPTAPRRAASAANHDTPNYLATSDPARALARLSRRGWAVFGHIKM